MPLLYPDNLKHNNPNNPLIEVDQLKGYYNINVLSERDIIPLAKRSTLQLVVCKDTTSSYIFKGNTTADVDWNNVNNWEKIGDSVTICDKTDVEQTIPTENTKATSALRAWQGFVYWIKNTTFSDLTTTTKTVQGSINELAANTLKGNTTEHTTPIDADSIGVWDSVAAVFKRLPLLTLYNFFVAKSVPPEEASEILDTDVVFGGRGTDAKYWAVSLWVQKLIGYLPKDAAYMAASWADVQAICESATCPESVAIHLTADVQMGNLTSYAKNIVFSGRQCILPDAGTPLFVGAGTTGSFSMTFESGVGCYGATGTLTFGSGTYVQNWDVRIRDIVGLAVTGTVLTVNKATGSIVSFKYNDAIDISFASASTSTRVQADMWYTLTKTVLRNRQTGTGNAVQSFFIGYLPVGWQLDSVRFKYVSGGGAAMTLQPTMQVSGSTYTDIAYATAFGTGGYSTFGARDNTAGVLFYDSPAGMNVFNAIVINTTSKGKQIAALATDSSNVVFDVIIEIHKV